MATQTLDKKVKRQLVLLHNKSKRYIQTPLVLVIWKESIWNEAGEKVEISDLHRIKKDKIHALHHGAIPRSINQNKIKI